ncbi:MAG TPA: hypothetical protein PKN87_10175 [Syntrophomonadaceae bacterium]|nr:hypothetical protein [Syntrophomonadaceae bacterium]HPR94313.1 hypothetical protein [Syntrophomonadaceae bacterium]
MISDHPENKYYINSLYASIILLLTVSSQAKGDKVAREAGGKSFATIIPTVVGFN